ncbi:MAG: MMPL family transporter [Methanomassiliicoccus sp.]|nr:MMPL family transporter [Methanomassiliicoccus sp.]
MLDRLANMIVKHPKAIVVFWIAVLLISIPAMMQLNSVVSYQITDGASSSYESLKAQDIIDENFQTAVANGTAFIVLQSDNVTDAEIRDYVLALQERIESSKDITYFGNISSIYSVSDLVIAGYVQQLGPNLYSAETQVNTSAFLLYGIPYIYEQNWAYIHSTYPSYTTAQVDGAAYAATGQYLEQALATADASNKTMANGYYHAFTGVWNATAASPTLSSDPMARANYSISMVAPTFISQLPSEYQPVMNATLSSFNLQMFSNPEVVKSAVHSFTLNLVSQKAGITNMTFLQDIYNLGPTYDAAKVNEYAHSVMTNGTLSSYPVQIPATYLSSFVASNNHTMLVMVGFTVDANYVTDDGDKPLLDDVKVIRNIVSDLNSAQHSSITTYVTGDAAISSDMKSSSERDLAIIEPLTIIIIIVLMGIMFRSVLAQWIPLGAVAIAIGISEALVFFIGTYVANVMYFVTTLLVTVLLGVGTDYSIFLMTRYKEERIKGATREQAVHTAVTWAGESILTSGATVIIAFLAMSTASYSMVQTMGLILGLAIVVALLVALTLVPSLIMVFGNRIFWPNNGQRWKRYCEKYNQKKAAGNRGYFHRAASNAVKYSKIIVIVAILASLPAAYIYATAETSFDFIGSIGSSESTDGLHALSQDFGAGLIMPTYVVMDSSDVTIYNGTGLNMQYMDAVENITATIAANHEVQSITSPTRPYGELVDYHNFSGLSAEIQQKILSMVGTNNQTVLITVTLTDEPMSTASVNLMPTLRDELNNAVGNESILSGTQILVGGQSAVIHDLSVDMNHQFTFIETLVVIGIFIVLMLVLGSVLLPAFAVVSIALSIAWSFAATYFVFGVWMDVPLLFLVPLILFVMLMGIGMDYNVFILTRIREEAHKGKGTNDAVIDAVEATGGIITALALIMAGAFGSLMLSTNTMLQEFGFALAFAVLCDAMIVRTYIVPAAMSLMGEKAWWAPGRLQRVGKREKLDKKEGPKDVQ